MNRRHKQFATVLGLAVTALAVDRLLGPGEAAADAPSPATAVNTPVAGTTSASAALAAAQEAALEATLEASMAERLEAIATQRVLAMDTVPDAFELPALWRGDDAPIVRGGSSGFAGAHQLQAALANGADSLAIIDGRTVRLGQVFAGMRLEEVHERSVVFSSPDGERIELPIE